MKVPSKEKILEAAWLKIMNWSTAADRKDESLTDILEQLADDLQERFSKDTLKMVGSIEFVNRRPSKRR